MLHTIFVSLLIRKFCNKNGKIIWCYLADKRSVNIVGNEYNKIGWTYWCLVACETNPNENETKLVQFPTILNSYLLNTHTHDTVMWQYLTWRCLKLHNFMSSNVMLSSLAWHCHNILSQVIRSYSDWTTEKCNMIWLWLKPQHFTTTYYIPGTLVDHH